MALENAGPGLREVCEAIGIPPILHLGSCVDNSRILTIASAMAAEGGLSDEIGGMPAVGIAPEWMTEKAMAIGMLLCGFRHASYLRRRISCRGQQGGHKDYDRGLDRTLQGCIPFRARPGEDVALALDYIDKARTALKLRKYEPGKFGTEKVLMDMAARRDIEKAAKPHIGIY